MLEIEKEMSWSMYLRTSVYKIIDKRTGKKGDETKKLKSDKIKW